MQYLDKLIEYHFQRKISGVSLEEIQGSLEGQSLEDEDRALVMKEVQRREKYHIQLQRQLRHARHIIIFGVFLVVVSSIVLYLIFIHNINYSYYIGISLFLFAILALLAGYLVSKKRISVK